MKVHLLFALLLCSTLTFAQGTGEVIITEIHNRPLKPTQAQLDAALPNNPSGANTTPNEGHTEWFEIYNTTSSPVVMDGWTIEDGSNGATSVIGSFTIAANSYAVFAGFNIPSAQGGVVFDYFYDYKKPSFNNESSYADPGDTSCPDGVILLKANGDLVDQVLYDYGYGEYIGNPEAGSSCSSNTSTYGFPGQNSSSRTSFMLNANPAVMNATANDLAANWSFSTSVYDDNSGLDEGDQFGTPGVQNDGAVDSGDTGTGQVIITEIHNRPLKPTQAQLDAALPNNPSGANTTPNEGHTEWFEIYNTTSSPVVMDGWTIEDGSNGATSVIGSFTLAANSYAVFAGFNIPDAQGGLQFDYFYDYKKPSFNNESSYADPGDTNCPDGVILTDGSGTLVDQVLYDYGYGEYIGLEVSCGEATSAIGFPGQNSSSRVSFMLNLNPAVMNAIDNDLAANWSFSTSVYDDNSGLDEGDQFGTPGAPNDGVGAVDNDGDGFFSDVDCNDNNAAVNPGATEIPDNGLDDDCDPSTLDGDVEPCTGEVIITEIHNRPLKPNQTQLDAALPNNPSGANTTPNEGHTEWFEIYNTTSSPVVMDGWTIEDGSNGNTSVISSFTIAANSYAVFAGFNIPDAQGGLQFDYFYDYKKPSFNNESSYADAGDTSCPDGVRLTNAAGGLVDEVLYDYGYGNYLGNIEAGSCQENAGVIGFPGQNSSSRTSFMLNADPSVMNCVDNNFAANWSFSTLVYDDNSADPDAGDQFGTPGGPNDGGGSADGLELQAKIFLEGCYNEDNSMTTNLTGQISANQPYNVAPWNYQGSETLGSIPSNMVDWVLVEARSGTPNLSGAPGTTVVEQKAGLLLSDGSITDLDGAGGVRFDNLSAGTSYYFSIRHRNHLDVLTATSVVGATSMNYDFTSSVAQAFGTLQQKSAVDGKAVLFAGDINADVVIQVSDYDIWFENSAVVNTYLATDLNLDAVSQVTDYDVWFNNKAKVGIIELQY